MARSTSIITSRSATGSRLRSVVTPGASSAAAICLVPAFFVAPAMRTEPCSGRPARTTKESVIAVAGHSDEAQREVVLELGRARHPPHRDRGDDPGDRALAQRHDGEAVAQRGGDLVVGEDLPRPGGVAQARREVDRHADEVVALEDDHLARGDADAQRQDDAGVLHALGEVEHRLDHRPDLGGDEHAAVAEPLPHPDPVVGGRAAHDRPGTRPARRVLRRHPGCRSCA